MTGTFPARISAETAAISTKDLRASSGQMQDITLNQATATYVHITCSALFTAQCTNGLYVVRATGGVFK